MSLPNPDYLTDELDNSFTGITYPSVVVEDADATFTKKLIQWRDYDKFSHQILHSLIMAYAAVNGITEANALTSLGATAPFYFISFGGHGQQGSQGGTLAAGDLTNSAYHVDVERTATIVTDSGGTETVTIAATGGAPVTYNDVISAINTQTSTTIAHYDNSNNPWHQNMYLQGGTADSTGTLQILDGNLFRDMIGFTGLRSFSGIDAPGSGGTANENGGLRGALELNLRSNRPYAEQFKYWQLEEGPPIGSTSDQNRIFYNNNAGEWQYVYDGSTVA